MEFRDVYAVHAYDSGSFQDYVHDIELIHPHVKPVSDKIRRFPLETNKLIQQHLDQMEQAGIIRKGISAWAANVVPIAWRVAGSDQVKFRLVTDMCKIKKVLS